MLLRILTILMLALAVPQPADGNERVRTDSRASSEVSVPQLKVSPYGVELIVEADSGEFNFRIYSITGQVVKTLKLSEGSELIELPQGCYIVKCEAWSKKIIIR